MGMTLNPLTGKSEDDNLPAVTPTQPPEGSLQQKAWLRQQDVLANQTLPARPVINNPTPEKLSVAPQPVPVIPETPLFNEPAGGLRRKEGENTSSTTSTKQVLPTVSEAPLLQTRDGLNQQELDVQKRAGELGKEKAVSDFAQAQEKEKLSLENKVKQQELIDKGEVAYRAAVTERDTQYTKLKEMKINDFWQDKSTGNKVLAGFAILLGGIGGGMTGKGGNSAMDVINKAIDTDLEKQKANIQQQIDVVNQSEKGIKVSKEQQEYLLGNLNLIKAASYGTLADKAEVTLAKRGLSAAQIQADAGVIALRQKQNDGLLDHEKGLRKTTDSAVTKQITSSMEAPPAQTDGQGKAKGFLTRMSTAAKNYDEAGGISAKGADAIREHRIENYIESKDANGLVKWALKPGSKPLPAGLSEKDRLAWSAMEDFARANLRKESGAAIGQDEFAAEIDQIMPTAGDTPAITAAKRKTMTTRMAAVSQELQPGTTLNMPAEPTQQVRVAGNNVEMLTPDGRLLSVPANRVKDMEVKGAKRK